MDGLEGGNGGNACCSSQIGIVCLICLSICPFLLEVSPWTLFPNCSVLDCSMTRRKPLNPNLPHAPKRPVVLNKEEFVKAVQNALRYFPKKYHELLAPEFANELKTYGHIYMYRWVVSRGGHSQFLPHGVRDEGVPPEHVPRQVPAGCLHPAHDHEQPRRQVATALETEA